MTKNILLHYNDNTPLGILNMSPTYKYNDIDSIKMNTDKTIYIQTPYLESIGDILLYNNPNINDKQYMLVSLCDSNDSSREKDLENFRNYIYNIEEKIIQSHIHNYGEYNQKDRYKSMIYRDKWCKPFSMRIKFKISDLCVYDYQEKKISINLQNIEEKLGNNKFRCIFELKDLWYKKGNSDYNLDKIKETCEFQPVITLLSVQLDKPINSYKPNKFSFINLEADEEICSICMNNLNTDNRGKTILKCGHKYHMECINRWFNINSNSPYSNDSVRHYK